MSAYANYSVDCGCMQCMHRRVEQTSILPLLNVPCQSCEANEWRTPNMNEGEYVTGMICRKCGQVSDEPARRRSVGMDDEVKPLLLDIGCGPVKAIGHIGLDRYPFSGVDVVRDLRRGLPFNDDTFDGLRAHHVLEHFAGEDLLFLVNEVWRVVRSGGILEITVPDATSPNRYRDPTHVERDWHEDSFMLWEVNEAGEYSIFVGSSYDRRAKLRRLTTAVSSSRDRLYRLEVVKP